MTNIHHHQAPFVKKRIKSFKYAIRGFYALILSETNARLHLVAMVLAIAAGIYLKINATEWCLIIFCIASVIATEGVNTAIEKLSDHVNPNFHRHIKKVKDLSASAVLVFTVSSVIIGLIIFAPKVLKTFNLID